MRPPKVRIPLPKQKPKIVPNKKKRGGKLKYNRIPEDDWGMYNTSTR